MTAERTLSRQQVRGFYDRIGQWQDTQAFYEASALDVIAVHGAFEEAQAVFEVGCGTGRFAEQLLRDQCPPETQYVGVDLSATMVQITRDRLDAYADRATVIQTDGTFSYDVLSGSQDRVVATYLLDLLSTQDMHSFLDEAHRLLSSSGRLCLASLTEGRSPLGRAVSSVWKAVHTVRPQWIGGCRPRRMWRFVDAERWREIHHEIVRSWGVPSEVLVVTPR